MTVATLIQPSAAGLDVEWDPSLATHIRRLKRLAVRAEELPSYLPPGFPLSIDSRRVWSGDEFRSESDYVYTLSSEDILEINAAMSLFKGRCDNPSLDLDSITPRSFPLPNIGSKLADVSDEIHSGQGFFVIRGLDYSLWSGLDRILAYAGVVSYIGPIRASQDPQGSKLIHIMDHGGAKLANADNRQAPYSAVAQPFHSDTCDILAMHVHQTAAAGGAFRIASTGKIYNEIASKRPDMIHTLAAGDWVFDEYASTPTWSTRPLLYRFGEHGPSFCYSRRPLTGSSVAPRTPGVPSMTERQAEALDTVHFTAVRHQLRLDLHRGDVMLVNNLAVMHAREAFTNDGEKGEARHMVRMWLRDEEKAWPTPAPLVPEFQRRYGADSPWNTAPTWQIEPVMNTDRILCKNCACS